MPTNPGTSPAPNSSLETKAAAARRIATSTKTPSSSHGNGQSFLQVDEWNGEYANIRIGGQEHDTPGAKFYLAAGTYSMIVKNDTQTFKCKVTLDSGKSRHMHVSWENQQCSSD